MNPTEEQIATELRALRPEITERFAADLDAWAAEGFPSREHAPEPAPSFPDRLRTRLMALRLRPFLPALAVATTMVAVVIGLASVLDDGGGSGPTSGGTSIQSQEDAGKGAQSPPGLAERGSAGAVEPAPTTVPPVPPADEQLKPGQERIQEQSASMELSTEPDDVDHVADEVFDVVDRYEGIVVSSNVDTSSEKARASFDLRIPTANLQAALADLSDLASVSSRNEGVLDITAPFITAEERYEDAKAEVDALLEELGEADSVSEIASIREQLALARPELAAARAELGALKQRADFSTLSLAVVGDGDGDGWSLGDAADDALSVLEDVLGAGLVTLAVIVPLGAIAALAWFGFGALRRRRRESALDN